MKLLYCISAVQCEKDFSRYGDYLYKFFDASVDWDTARSTCLSHNAYLVEPRSAEESNYIKSLGNRCGGRRNFWIGGIDIEDVEVFYWSYTGDLVESSFTDWYRGEPSDAEEKDIENCIEIRPNFNNQWNDEECHRPRAFVCQKGILIIIQKKLRSKITVFADLKKLHN